MKRIIATPNKDVVVFIIGLRINRLRSVRQWLPTVQAMGPMLQECYANDVGLISHESLVGWRSLTLIQYWRSTEELMAYAHGSRHLTAWKRFNQKARTSEAVGI
ncbi:monooxygenase family protein, partial [Exiguobacterium sp.]